MRLASICRRGFWRKVFFRALFLFLPLPAGFRNADFRHSSDWAYAPTVLFYRVTKPALALGRDLNYPAFAALRGDPRVKALRKKIGLPESSNASCVHTTRVLREARCAVVTSILRRKWQFWDLGRTWTRTPTSLIWCGKPHRKSGSGRLLPGNDRSYRKCAGEDAPGVDGGSGRALSIRPFERSRKRQAVARAVWVAEGEPRPSTEDSRGSCVPEQCGPRKG